VPGARETISEDIIIFQQFLVMDQQPAPPPPPSNPFWHRFANLYLTTCPTLVDAYLGAGYQCTRNTAYVNGWKLFRKPVVAEYIRYWTQVQHEQRQKEFRAALASF
jgi:hypothetical protein